MLKGVHYDERLVAKMKADDEFEKLLSEIPHVTSSLNLHHSPALNDELHRYQHQKRNNVKGHGYGHASPCVPRCVNGHGQHGHGYVGGIHGDKVLRHNNYACPSSSSSPLSGFSFPSDGSSTSLLSGNGLSLSATGSPTSHFDELKNHPLCNGNGSGLVDEFNLAGDLSKMCIGNRQEGVSTSSHDIRPFDLYPNRAFQMNPYKDESFDRYESGFTDAFGWNATVSRGPMSYDREIGAAFPGMQDNRRIPSMFCSDRSLPQFRHANSVMSPQFQRTNEMPNNILPMRYPESYRLDRPMLGNGFFYASQNGMNLIETNSGYHHLPHMVQTRPYYNEGNSPKYQPPMSIDKLRAPQRKGDAFAGEESFIMQGYMPENRMNRGGQRQTHWRGHNRKGLCHNGSHELQESKMHIYNGRFTISPTKESCRSPKMFSPSFFSSQCVSLVGSREHICHWAKDQNGGRYLQEKLDQGNEVDLIFNEIINEAVELMVNPFGNYLMQKLLEVCDEEQRLHIILRVTEKPGQLVEISLNMHGTRVVQKLIETLTSKQQIKLVVSALEPGFLRLIKDLNGNHVVQRCLQSFSDEDSKFIFVAAAKHCVEIATHQHGCCVLQQCIAHSTGNLKENLVARVSANSLHLAQDAYGNYVVQFVLDLNIQSATTTMTTQFSGHYVDLSRQKFSSHVVEKCLHVCDDEVKSSIIYELLCVNYFDQLLQHPLANYVIQTALYVSEGASHNALVDKIKAYKDRARNSPYSKGIFSKKLLKK